MLARFYLIAVTTSFERSGQNGLIFFLSFGAARRGVLCYLLAMWYVMWSGQLHEVLWSIRTRP